MSAGASASNSSSSSSSPFNSSQRLFRTSSYVCLFVLAAVFIIALTPTTHPFSDRRHDGVDVLHPHRNSHNRLRDRGSDDDPSNRKNSIRGSSISSSSNKHSMLSRSREGNLRLFARRAEAAARQRWAASPASAEAAAAMFQWQSPKPVYDGSLLRLGRYHESVASLSDLHKLLYPRLRHQHPDHHPLDDAADRGGEDGGGRRILAKTYFDELFALELVPSRLHLVGEEMQQKALKMFAAYPMPTTKKSEANASRPRLHDVHHIEEQHVLSVTNLVTNEHSLFNPLRNYRPGAMQGLSKEQDDAINAKYSETAGKDRCDFCDGLHRTAEDVPFGRIVGRRCFTASNIGKLSRWHSLLISNQHNPLRFDVEDVVDWFAVARKYFSRANAADPRARFPTLIFDAGARASASQPHMHIHLLLTHRRYLTGMHTLMERAYEWSYSSSGAEAAAAAEGKSRKRGRRAEDDDGVAAAAGAKDESARGDYFQEWIRAHDAVGLALQHGGAWLVVPLSPIHDKEVFVVGRSNTLDMQQLVYFALKFLVASDALHMRAFSMSAVLEELDHASHGHDGHQQHASSGEAAAAEDDGTTTGKMFPVMPAIVRIMDRGSPLDVRNDAGALEFYGSFNIPTDPYRVMAEARKLWCTMPFVAKGGAAEC